MKKILSLKESMLLFLFKNEVVEFRFKWDDDAKWFGVEQVVY